MSQQHQKQIKRAFEKGKLKQKEEELGFLAELKPKEVTIINFVLIINEMVRKIKKRIRQLQKEIGGNEK